MKFVKSLNEAEAAKEIKRIQEKVDKINEWKKMYHKVISDRIKRERFHGRLLEAARNDSLGSAIKAIYITALENYCGLSDDETALAESIVENWVKESGGTEVILSTKNQHRTYLLARLAKIVEDAAQRAVMEVESIEEADKDDDEEEKKEDKTEEKEEEKKEEPKEEEKEEESDKAEEETPANDDVEEGDFPDEDLDKDTDNDDEEDEEEEEEVEDHSDELDIDMDDDDEEPTDDAVDYDEAESDDEEEDVEEEEPEEGEEPVEDSGEEEEIDTSDVEDAGDEEVSDAEADQAGEEILDDTPNEDEDDSDVSDAEMNSDDDSSDDDETYEVDDEDDSVDSDQMYKDLEDEEDVKKAIDTIQTRVADAEEKFIKKNAEDKKKVDEILHKINNSVKTVEEIDDDENPKSQAEQEHVIMYKRQLNDLANRAPKSVFEAMANEISKSTYLAESAKAQMSGVTEKVDTSTDAIIGKTRILYGFLETLNTLRLEDVNENYIKKVINEIN